MFSSKKRVRIKNEVENGPQATFLNPLVGKEYRKAQLLDELQYAQHTFLWRDKARDAKSSVLKLAIRIRSNSSLPQDCTCCLNLCCSLEKEWLPPGRTSLDTRARECLLPVITVVVLGMGVLREVGASDNRCQSTNSALVKRLRIAKVNFPACDGFAIGGTLAWLTQKAEWRDV